MRGRWLVALVLVSVVTLAVASATSLGSFNDVILSARSSDRTPCTVVDVDFLSGGTVLAGLVDLITNTVDEIALRTLGGTCADLRPVVVVYGDPDFLDGTAETVVLSRTQLDPLVGGEAEAILPVDPLDELNTLLNLDDDPTDVRVLFCPVGTTVCEPS